MQLLGIEVEAEKFDELICEQNKGKKLEIVDGNIIAVDYQPTKKEIKADELLKLENWFNSYFERQLIQSFWQNDFVISHDDVFGVDYSTIDELKAKGEEVRTQIKNLRLFLNTEE